ncbi:MAG: hypothetical protein M5R36_00025 [Deltaproteobacteria bacterium]|nr:hypothetical protein [Deltaproteobacteria bacterium]
MAVGVGFAHRWMSRHHRWLGYIGLSAAYLLAVVLISPASVPAYKTPMPGSVVIDRLDDEKEGAVIDLPLEYRTELINDILDAQTHHGHAIAHVSLHRPDFLPRALTESSLTAYLFDAATPSNPLQAHESLFGDEKLRQRAARLFACAEQETPCDPALRRALRDDIARLRRTGFQWVLLHRRFAGNDQVMHSLATWAFGPSVAEDEHYVLFRLE